MDGSFYPKYQIFTVVYAPPGADGGSSTSGVNYSQASTIGTAVSTNSSFKQGFSFSVTASGGVLGTSTSITVSNSETIGSTRTQTAEVRKTEHWGIKGQGADKNWINHDFDVTWHWLNPIVHTSITGKKVEWALAVDGPSVDLQYLYVAQLKNPQSIPDGVRQRLVRYNITAADFPEILKADPFADGSTTIGIGYRKFKRPFSSTRKVQLDLSGVNHGNPRSRIGDFSGPSSARGAQFRDQLASRVSEGVGGMVGSGAEPECIGYQLGIRPFGIDQIAAPGIGAVSGRTSRDERGSWQSLGDLRWRQ